jgi:3-deoxy-D-manno-octulosonic-acid transferase
LGVASERIYVTGSIKFDIHVSEQQIEQGRSLRASFGQERPVWIAASTHNGEDEHILEVHRQLLHKHPDLLLIIVPRHPERFNDVAKLCHDHGFNTKKRSEMASALTAKTSIVVGDTMGEMMTYLAASDVCFMGGSLLGKKVGGHNLLEPAAIGIPSLIGPSYFNFKEITQQLVDNQGTIVCENTEQIFCSVSNLIEKPSLASTMGSASQQVVRQNQGALTRTLDSLSTPV